MYGTLTLSVKQLDKSTFPQIVTNFEINSLHPLDHCVGCHCTALYKEGTYVTGSLWKYSHVLIMAARCFMLILLSVLLVQLVKETHPWLRRYNSQNFALHIGKLSLLFTERRPTIFTDKWASNNIYTKKKGKILLFQHRSLPVIAKLQCLCLL